MYNVYSIHVLVHKIILLTKMPENIARAFCYN